MASIIITPKTSEELQFLLSLLERLGTASHLVSEEEKEDIGLALMLREVDRSDKVSREEVMKKLRQA